MKRTVFSTSALICGLALAAAVCSAAETKRPNILVILANDKY